VIPDRISGGTPITVTPTFRAAEVYAPVTKYAVMASSVQELPHVMRRAYQAMRSGKPGPVLVEVPNRSSRRPFEGTLDYKPVPVLSQRAGSRRGERSGTHAARGQKSGDLGGAGRCITPKPAERLALWRS
jgi:glyoxylate carboligase